MSEWTVTDLESADWALMRLGELRKEMDENEVVLLGATHRLEQRHQELKERLQRDVDFFESHLRKWAEDHRGELLSGKKKSRALLHGSIGWRTKPAGLKVLDEASLLLWADENGKVVTEKRVAMGQVKEWHQQTGEVPPGTEVVPESETFSAKPEDV